VVAVVVTAMVKGWPACMRGEVSCTIKDEGEKRGNDLSEAFLGALGTVRATAVGWLVCAHDACEGVQQVVGMPTKGDVVVVVVATGLVR